MNRIMVNIYVPALQESFDVYIPTDLKLSKLTELIAEGVRGMSGEKYSVSGKELLSLKSPDALLTGNKTPRDYGLVNGDHLVMI